MADATRSHEVETKQTLAPTLEDGTLRTADDGEPNPPTGAASSITISSEQFDRVMSAVKRMNAEGMQKQARELFFSSRCRWFSPIPAWKPGTLTLTHRPQDVYFSSVGSLPRLYICLFQSRNKINLLFLNVITRYSGSSPFASGCRFRFVLV